MNLNWRLRLHCTRQIDRGWLKLTSKSYYPVLNLICLMWAHSFPRTEYYCLSLEIKWCEVGWKIKEASAAPAVSVLTSKAIHQKYKRNHLFVSKSIKWLLSHCWSLQCRPVKYRSCSSKICHIIPVFSETVQKWKYGRYTEHSNTRHLCYLLFTVIKYIIT